jgi:hypothetical protein
MRTETVVPRKPAKHKQQPLPFVEYSTKESKPKLWYDASIEYWFCEAPGTMYGVGKTPTLAYYSWAKGGR